MIAPLGGTCALLVAVTGPGGTASACPSPRNWQLNEMAMVGTYVQGYIQPALYHNRGGTMNCFSRAVTAGIVQ